MSPDYVAQGLYKLVSQCDNGAVMGAVKDTPFFIIPDTGHVKLLTMILMAKIILNHPKNGAIKNTEGIPSSVVDAIADNILELPILPLTLIEVQPTIYNLT